MRIVMSLRRSAPKSSSNRPNSSKMTGSEIPSLIISEADSSRRQPSTGPIPLPLSDFADSRFSDLDSSKRISEYRLSTSCREFLNSLALAELKRRGSTKRWVVNAYDGVQDARIFQASDLILRYVLNC